MKKNSLFIFTIFITLKLFSQGKGFIVENDILTDVNLKIYNPPLKLKQVKKQRDINYENIEGLLQSYFSANNLEWAKSEYLNNEEKIVRDQEHFNAVKKRSKNDYIQLEMSYSFKYDQREFSIIKYAIITDLLPFPWVSLFFCEKANNRWYFNNLVNQNQILLLLGNYKSKYLLDYFNKKSEENKVFEKLNKFIIQNELSLRRLSLNLDKLNDEEKKYYYDERIYNDNIDFKNAKINSIPTINNFKLLHPFTYESFAITNYKNSKNGVLKNEVTLKEYNDSPEKLLLDENNEVNFISKTYIQTEKRTFHLIKYKKNNKFNIELVEEINKEFSIVDVNELNEYKIIFLKYKTDFLFQLISDYKNIDYNGSSGGINLNELIHYLKSNSEKFKSNTEK